MLQQLRPDSVRQNPLDQTVRFMEQIVALCSIEGRVVSGCSLGLRDWDWENGRFCVDLYGCCFLRLGLGGVKASSAGVSLGLLGDLWAR